MEEPEKKRDPWECSRVWGDYQRFPEPSKMTHYCSVTPQQVTSNSTARQPTPVAVTRYGMAKRNQSSLYQRASYVQDPLIRLFLRPFVRFSLDEHNEMRESACVYLLRR